MLKLFKVAAVCLVMLTAATLSLTFYLAFTIVEASFNLLEIITK